MTMTAKVMLLGDIGVGKTSLARRLVFDRFDGEYRTTIGVEILTFDVAADLAAGRPPLRMVLWDTDGDFGHHIFETVYMAGAAGAVIVADATRPATIARMAGLCRNFGERLPGRPFRAIVNKTDLGMPDAGELSAAGISPADLFFTSARTGEWVAEVFAALAAAIHRMQG